MKEIPSETIYKIAEARYANHKKSCPQHSFEECGVDYNDCLPRAIMQYLDEISSVLTPSSNNSS